MNLTDLIESGVLIRDGFTKKNLTWNNLNFDVYVKNEMSVSDYEYITQFGKASDSSADSYMARMVSVNVRLGENACEALPYDVAVKFKTSFLSALVEAVNDSQAEEVEKKSEGAKKNDEPQKPTAKK